MAQQLASFSQAASAGQNSRGSTVSEPVGANRTGNPCLPRRFHHDIGHADPAQRPVGGTINEENMALTGHRRPAHIQICGNGLTDISRHRHELTGIAFARDSDRSGPPIKIIDCQPCDFTRPQAQANQQQEYRTISGGGIDGKQGCDLAGW